MNEIQILIIISWQVFTNIYVFLSGVGKEFGSQESYGKEQVAGFPRRAGG